MGQYNGIIGGIDTMVANRFTPWHYSYNEDRVALVDLKFESGQQALVAARCDWGVNLVSLAEFMPDAEGADQFFLNMRSDSGAVLGVHKKRYHTLNNSVVGDLADAVLTTTPEADIISAGSLYVPGKQVWILVELPNGTKLGGREVHEKYVLISTSHDGSLALTIRSTRVRVECMNTMSMALNGSRADYVIRHTTNALDYVEEAKRGIAVATENALAWDAAIEELMAEELDPATFQNVIVPAVIEDRPEEAGRGQTMWDAKFDAIVDAYGAEHNEAIVGSAWGAVNAINEYEEWGINPRGQEVHEAQFKRLLTGDYDLTRKALALVS